MEFGGTQKPLRFKPISKTKLSVVCSNFKFPLLFPRASQIQPLSKCRQENILKEKKIIEKEIKQLLKDDNIEEFFPMKIIGSGSKRKKKLGDVYWLFTIGKSIYRLGRFSITKNWWCDKWSAKYRYFSKFDLRNAYHQIPLHPQDMKLTVI